MPTLPTLTVTQDKADRIQAAFGSSANYKAELRKWVRQRVLDAESDVIRQQRDTDLEAKTAEIASDFSDANMT